MADGSNCRDAFGESFHFYGGRQSGKTQALVERACMLTGREGAESILLVCLTPRGAQDASARLESILGDGHGIRVVSVRDIALEIMGQPLAFELFGRRPRVLDFFEERFLMEDMRTASIKGRRLTDVMNFLRAGWSRLADDDPGWLITLEEESIASLLRDNLRFTGGILACELGNFAVNVLRHDGATRGSHTYDHVLSDDFERLDRASQTLLRMMAGKSFAFSSGPMDEGEARGTYPYFSGVGEFVRDHPDLRTVFLDDGLRPESLAGASGRLLVARDGSEKVVRQCSGSSAALVDEGSACFRMGRDMGDELRIIERECRNALSSRQSVLVVGANGIWRSNALRRLAEAGLPVAKGEKTVSVKDFRNDGSCRLAVERTLQRLAEDPHDGVAWRSIVGFGDYVARSAALECVRKAASSSNVGIEEALRLLAEGRLPGANAQDPLLAPLVQSFERGRAEVERAEARCSELGDAPSRGDVHGGGKGGRSSSGRVCEIRVISPNEARDLQADVVVLGCFVDGCIPSRAYLDGVSLVGRARERARTEDLRALYGIVGSARRRLLLTGFESCSLETAERMGLHISNIKLRRGMRVCAIDPSAYLELLLP